MSTQDIKEVVKEKYGEAARRVASGTGSSCCGAAPCGTDIDPIPKDLYDSSQTGILPEEAVKASLGCGNPTALAQLKAGETVVDLGSGGGIDVLLSRHQILIFEFFKMMGECGIGNLKLLADLPYHHAVRVGREKEPHDAKPGLRSHRRKHFRVVSDIVCVWLCSHSQLLLCF